MQMRNGQESAINVGKAALDTSKTSPFGQMRLAKKTMDEEGNVSETWEAADSKATEFTPREYVDKMGKKRIGRWNPKIGLEQTDADPLAEVPGNRRDMNKESFDLRKEFIDRPEVKEYVTVSTQVKSMDSMLENALAGNLDNQLALDQALITMYNKLTDPNSVVRESEYARTPENLPIVNRISGSIAKLKKGGAGLTNEDREALVMGAKIIGNERGYQFQRAKTEYDNLAKDYGIDSKLVTRTLPEFKPYEITPRRTKPLMATNPKTKERIQSLDGGKTWQPM